VCRGVVFHKGLFGFRSGRVETAIRIKGRSLVTDDRTFDLLSVELVEARPGSEDEPNVCIVDLRHNKTVGKLRVNPASVEELIRRASTPRLKLVLVGDSEVGKTCLLRSLLGFEFEETFDPTVFDSHETQFSIDGRQIIVDLSDISGHEDYDRLRPLAYPQVDAFLICFSATSPESKAKVLSRWLPETAHHCPDAPIVLCATKCDLVDEETQVTLREDIGGPVLLTNAHSQELVIRAFTECVAAGVLGPPKERSARPAPVVVHMSQDQLTKAAR